MSIILKKRKRKMRGYQKKVIYVKNTGSSQFEEAYFVIRTDNRSESSSADKMVEEANRIIKENFGGGKKGFLYSKRWHILAFFLGCAITLALCCAIGLYIN